MSATYALLDDQRPGAASRLYTAHVATLRARDHSEWHALLAQMEQALANGLHLVPLFSYELGGALLGLPTKRLAGPLAQVLVFRDCAELDAGTVDAWLAAHACGSAGVRDVRASVDEAAFSSAIARIRDYIAAGDTYQVNYTYRLRFDAWGSPLDLYRRLRARQPVPYGALIQLEDGSAIVSLSPELFVRHEGSQLTARPMKGTAAASADPAANADQAQALAADPKNRAENLMIVDLLRNDLGRIAATGSVSVPALFEVTRFGSVLQMTSTITAQLRRGAGLCDILDALYPCGSITGAPKRRTMEIIHELEADARGIYTGAIGWIAPPAPGQHVGDFCLSVPIRTLHLSAPERGWRHGELGVGAGIVYDSVAADEYAECQLKAHFLTGLAPDFELFETMHATHADGIRHRERHLKRLSTSAGTFGIPCDVQALESALDAACTALSAGEHRMRLALQPDGQHQITSAALTPLAGPVTVLIADDTMRADDPLLRHKTSQRQRYDAAWRDAEAAGAFDTLFFNERGELTEGGRSNIFIQLDGRWLTPALSCGLLPGVMRAVLLDDPKFKAREAIIRRGDLERADAILICNALRGCLPAKLGSESN